MSQLIAAMFPSSYVPPPAARIMVNTPREEVDSYVVHGYHQRGNDARIKVLQFLRQGSKTTAQVTEMLETSKSNALYHLKTLAKSGLVQTTARPGSKSNKWTINGA
jgi:predicted transcriptional regulator